MKKRVNTHKITVYLDLETYTRIATMAQLEERSLTKQVKSYINDGLAPMRDYVKIGKKVTHE